MFVIHGQSGGLSAIVATSSAQKAVFHFRRMSQSGLHPVIKNADGDICSPRSLQTMSASSGHAARGLH